MFVSNWNYFNTINKNIFKFHHRDPGLVGLLASDNIPSNKAVYFGIIADGIHTHPAALRIAHRVHPKGEYKPGNLQSSFDYILICLSKWTIARGNATGIVLVYIKYSAIT